MTEVERIRLISNNPQSALYSNKEQMCFRCHEIKIHSWENFHTQKEIRNGKKYEYIRKVCRKCEHDERAVNRRNSREKENENLKKRMTPLRHRERNLRRGYKMSLAQYDVLLQSQNGKCGICFNVETKTVNGKVSHLTVDHDHKTGRIRGLLCARCNSGIGLLMEKTENFKNAITYLSRGEL